MPIPRPPLDPVTLRADGVLLRPWAERDIPALHTLAQDPEIPAWTSLPAPYSPADARVYVLGPATEGWASGEAAHWAVVGADDELLGSMSLIFRSLPGVAEIGYWTGAPARGRGVAVAAGRAAVRHGLGTLGLRRVEWFAAVGNEASFRVAHQLGVRFEGVQRARFDGPVDAWGGAVLPGAEATTGRVPLRFGADPVLVDGPVTVRRWRFDEADRWLELDRDPEVQRWDGRHPEQSPDELRAAARRRMAEAVEGWMTGTRAAFAVLLDGVVVGDMGLRCPSPTHPTAEIGWSLGDPAARGRHVASRAARLITRWGLTEAGLQRIEARIDAANERSQRLARAAGYRLEGEFRRDAPAHELDGRLRDGRLYAITADDLR